MRLRPGEQTDAGRVPLPDSMVTITVDAGPPGPRLSPVVIRCNGDENCETCPEDCDECHELQGQQCSDEESCRTCRLTVGL